MKHYQTLFLIGVVGFGFAKLATGSEVLPNILLTVDISPSTVANEDFSLTITSTTGSSLSDSSNRTFFDGIDLTNFFAAPADFNATSPVFPSTLTTFIDKTPVYDTLFIDDYSTGDPNNALDLNLFSSMDTTGTFPETFDTGTQAFATPGSLQGYLNGTRTAFSPVGYIGNIYAGTSFDLQTPDFPGSDDFVSSLDELADSLTLIGQYEVIPEPSQWSMLLLGVGALFAARRFVVRKQS